MPHSLYKDGVQIFVSHKGIVPMVDKKRTDWSPEPAMLNDFNFDMDAFEGNRKEKGEKKRKPIMKVATSVAKGSLGHFTSEQFIRGTIARSLPRGYDTAINTGYEIKDTFGQLYNSASEEYRKVKPQLQRTVQRMMPTANKILPKNLAQRLNKFSLGDIQSGRNIDPDEEVLRAVLGELETTRESERLREYNERQIREDLKDQVESKRYGANMKALASIDARLAQMQAFNDQVFSRYQKRMLEVSYRQYFTQRDTLKLLGAELSQQRQLLTALVHNTGLPEVDKIKLREQVGQSIKSRLTSFAPLALGAFLGQYKKNLTDRLSGRIQGFGMGASNALSGVNMGLDANAMARSMGIDTTGKILEAIGGGATGFLLEQLLGRMGKGFSPAGFTAQQGARLGRHAGDWRGILSRWAGSRTHQTGILGTAISLLKSGLPVHGENRRLGNSFILDAGEQGTFTKKTQRSIETIIPGFLSKIHHELKMMRTGDHSAEAEVWNDEREDFSSKKERGADIRKRLFENKNAQFGVQNARDAVDFLAAGSKLSAATHQALTQEVLYRLASGQTVDPTDLMRTKNAKFLTPEMKKELSQLRGRFTDAKGQRDEVMLSQFQGKINNARASLPSIHGMAQAYMDLGHIKDLRDAGLVTTEGDSNMLNTDAWVRHIAGQTPTDRKGAEYKRGDYGPYGGMRPRRSLDDILNATYEDLFKPTDLNTPVIHGTAVMSGSYMSLKTGYPIHSMAGVLEGVSYNGVPVVSAEDAKKLVTRSGETLQDFLARTKRTPGPKGKLRQRMGDIGKSIDVGLASAGAHVDAFIDSRGYGGRRGRRRAVADIRHAAGHAAQSTKEGIARAAEKVGSFDAKQAYEQLSKRVKAGWAHAMNAGRYAVNLMLGDRVVISEAKLKAGGYVSAVTGKPIADLRDIVEGVKDAKTNSWVVSAQDAVDNLRMASGERFVEMVDRLQSAMTSVKETVEGTSLGAVFTPHAEHPVTPSASAAPIHEQIHEAATKDHWEPMMELVKEFKEGNLKNLEAILHVLMERDFAGGGGTPMGSGSPGFAHRGKDWAYKMANRLRNAPGALWRGTKGAAGLYGRYVKTVFGMPLKAASTLGNFAMRGFQSRDKLGKEPADVYVKGEKRERLTRGRMMAGEYFNLKPDGTFDAKKPIRVPKDIVGPVCDAQGNTLIDVEEFKRGLTDRSGHSFVGGVLRGLWATAKTLGGFYGSLITAPIKAIGMAGRFVASVANIAKLPQDVYVTGESEPRLRAFAMRAGNYVLKDNPRKKVRTVKDITGEVLDISKNPPVLALSKDDLSKGIVDSRGKPFKIQGSILARLAHGALSTAGSLGMGYMRVIGAMGRAGASLAMAPFNLLTRLLGFGGGRNLKAPKDGLPTTDQKTQGLLQEILSLLKERIALPKHLRKNSAAEELKKHQEELSAEDAAYAKSRGAKQQNDVHAKLGLGGLAGKAKGLLGSLKKGKNLLKGLAELKGAKGLLGKLGKFKNILTGGGEAAEAVEGAEGVAGAAEAVGGATTAAEGIAAAAGAAEAGGAVAAGAGAAGTILGGIAAVLSAPVVLGALAVAAVGYGAYKLYSNHKLKGQKLRTLRMAQYGVSVDKDLSNSKKVAELEELLEPHTTVANGKATINLKEISKDDQTKIAKIFGTYRSNWNPLNWLHKTSASDVLHQQGLAMWINNRFKPVFTNWIAAVRGLVPNMSICDVDDKMKPEQKKDLVKNITAGIDKSIYKQMASPFGDDPLTAGPAEVEAATKDVMKDLDGKKDTKGGLLKTIGGALSSAGAGLLSVMGIGKANAADATAGGAAKTALAAGAILAATKNSSGKGATSKIGVSQTSNLKSDFGFLGGKISALTAVRYKTYGLTEMDPAKAKALFLLEQDVFEKLEFSSDGTASFSDDATYYFDHYAGYYGISPTDKDAKLRWYSWFSKRFIPTILQYATAVKHANKTVDPRDAENFLGPQHLLDVATMTVAATFGSKLTTASVWTFTTDTPFGDNKPLNGDSNSTKDNIQVLKDAVQKQVLAEQKAKQAAQQQQQQAKPGTTSAKDGISTAATAGTVSANDKQKVQQAVKLPSGMEAGSQAAQQFIATGGKPGAPVGEQVSQPGHGTAGDINQVPQPTGSGYSGVKATLDAAAKMTGVDPKLLGTFTGIESSWNPNAAASTSSAKGLGQFLDSTWRAMLSKYGAKYGINPQTPQTDPRASALMLAEYIKENQAYLTKNLGRAPTDTELYIAHFLGPAGAVQLLKAPDNSIGASISPKAAAANASIFYRNGTALSKGDVVKVLDGRVGKFRAKVGAAAPGSSQPSPEMASTTLPNGAKTTTTANGPTGGIGANQPKSPASQTASTSASGGAQALASIQPPSGGKPSAAPSITMPVGGASIAQASTPDPVVQQQAYRQQQAVQADRQAQVVSDAQQQQSTSIAAYNKQQVDLLGQVVKLLTSIDGGVGQFAKAGGASGVPGSSSGSQVVSSPQAPATTPGGQTGVSQVAALPAPAVPMGRPNYG
jgi:hypothetical protein